MSVRGRMHLCADYKRGYFEKLQRVIGRGNKYRRWFSKLLEFISYWQFRQPIDDFLVNKQMPIENFFTDRSYWFFLLLQKFILFIYPTANLMCQIQAPRLIMELCQTPWAWANRIEVGTFPLFFLFPIEIRIPRETQFDLSDYVWGYADMLLGFTISLFLGSFRIRFRGL